MPDARSRLAAAQAALLDSLLDGTQPPPGFDPKRLEAAAAVLARKRRRPGWRDRLWAALRRR